VGLTVGGGGGHWNTRGSWRRGGEDVDRRPKGVGALLFGCSERAGRWRGGLLPGARSRRPWRKGLRRIERKWREMRMGCVGAGSAREKGGKGPSMAQREGGRGGVRSTRNSGNRSAPTRARRPWAGGRGRSKQQRWGAAVWAPWHSAGRPGQTAFNRFENQFKLIQMFSKSFEL
jgi:hypothetical protein